MHAARISSPIGPLYVEAEDGRITRLETNGREAPPDTDGHFAQLKAQLDEYFAGTRTTFDLPLAQQGTPFERRVWERLQQIPYGETVTYGELARELESSPRAVGRANGRNPISIVVPCHRVIGTNGSLTGYAGGLPIKRELLDHERGQGLLAGRPSRPPGVAI
jgi:methylated-DNA-[protein]-cysteine S-methyltransferase